ncbi:MAG: radical SAM protein [Sulfolobales archaeon]
MFRGNPCFREALLYDKLNGDVKCKTCERFCIVKNNSKGFCKTRLNLNGKFYTLIYGDVSSISANPIEKKPLFHFYPGSYALTMGSWSCNFTCPWCQNYMISKFPPDLRWSNYISPEKFVDMIDKYDCIGTSMSFNEPTLFLEYSIDVFKLAKNRGYYNTFVTNGYMSLEALKLLCDSGLDAVNVDIKGDYEAVLKYCGADVEKVWRNCIEFKCSRGNNHINYTWS